MRSETRQANAWTLSYIRPVSGNLRSPELIEIKITARQSANKSGVFRMKTKQNRWVFRTVSMGLIAIVFAVSWNVASGLVWQDATAEQMMPQSTFLYAEFEGVTENAEAYKETAEYAAFVDSGLADLFQKVVDFAIARDNTGKAEGAKAAVEDLINHGFILSASLAEEQDQLIPSVRFIFNEGGSWTSDAVNLLQEMLAEKDIEVEMQKVGRRQIASFIIPESPGIQVGMWKEGESMVVVVGPDVVNSTMACITGDAPNISQNERLQAVLKAETDFEQTGLSWLDWQALQNKYGDITLPIPQQLTIAEVLEIAGLDKLDSVINRGGYRGESQWTETSIVGLGQQEGPMLTLKDLPPLPSKPNWFNVFQCNPAALHDQLVSLAKNNAGLMGPDGEEQVNQIIESLQQMLGFDPKADLLDHLGNVACIYDDANGGVFGTGITFCVKLKNPEGIESFIDAQMARLEKAEENGEYLELPVYPYRIEQDGKDLIVFDITGEGDQTFQYGAVRVVEDWLVVGIMPQSIKSFQLRVEGKLPAWEPDAEYQAALAELPKEFTSLTAVNTRDTYQLMLNWGMMFLPVLQQSVMDNVLEGDEEMPFYVEDFPPAEAITAPMFPNLAVSVADENGIKFYSRSSTVGIPMMGGNSGMSSVSVAAVGVALLLPAVQQARAAARGAQSKNNMKQIGLAMHNYADTYGHFPSGTMENAELKPDERLSWAASILPFIEEGFVYEQLQKDQAWNAGENEVTATFMISTYMDPAQNQNFEEFAPIHYAGIAGTGKNAATLKIGQPGCGIFGYDRETRFRDITDGTSNTMMVTQVNDDIGPWAQGGKSTIRSLTQQPYVNGPDGIGGPFQNDVVFVLMADGSVRAVSANIDPKTFENLAEMADGNVVGEF
ncbi:MAG TPA: hypothetical protein DD473_07145 [Planctomycetaceae bacterium]|nr:hypothetical protein [Planctomycetaceae bacterium]